MHRSTTAVPADAADAPRGNRHGRDAAASRPVAAGGEDARRAHWLKIAAPRAEPSLGLWTAQPEGRFTFVMHALCAHQPARTAGGHHPFGTCCLRDYRRRHLRGDRRC